MSDPIFLDYHSTTPVDPRVVQKVVDSMLVDFGNAHSTDHIFGDRAAKAVAVARAEVAKLLHAKAATVTFTSGSTEGINIVLNHICSDSKARVLVSETEHSAVLESCKKYAARLEKIRVASDGSIDLIDLERKLAQGFDLVCIMGANNEIGNIYPVQEISRLCQEYHSKYLCDASQSAGKIIIDFDAWNIDYVVISAHKMYGPKGVGALISKSHDHVRALFSKGSQERGVRPGTLNVPGIAGLGEACRLRALEMEEDEAAIAVKRDKLQKLLQNEIEGMLVNGNRDRRLSGNLHISVPGVLNDAVIVRIHDRLAISRGATCSAGVEEPSHVLQAIKLSESAMEGAFRIGLGKFTTEEEIAEAAKILVGAIADVRQRLKIGVG